MKQLYLLLAFIMPLAAHSQKAPQWIGAPWQTEEAPAGAARVAPLFSRDITIGKAVRSATLSVTGLGFFEFYIDGAKVGDEVLTPNETSYGHRHGLDKYFISVNDSAWRSFHVCYLVHDVAKQLSLGSHNLSAIVATGFYGSTNKRWLAPYGSPRFICSLVVGYADGTADTIVSNTQWLVRPSHYTESDPFAGEVYDATLHNDEAWQQAVPRTPPDGQLVPQEATADRVCERLHPTSLRRLPNGDYEATFADYVTGWLHFNRPIMMHQYDTLGIAFPIECAGNGVCKYIAGATGPQRLPSSHFTWWVFNKAIISGLRADERLSAADITAEVVHTDVRQAATFTCSDTLLCRINDIWCRTLTDNLHLGVMSDCPHREKGPYTGDGQIASLAAMHNYDMQAFYAKWLRDITDCQDTLTGYVPNGAPWHPGCGGGVPWGSAVCVIPWNLYLQYADTATLALCFQPMQQYTNYLARWRDADGTALQQIVSDTTSRKANYWMNLGEWCPPYSLASERLVHTWYLWRVALNTAYAARVLGQPALHHSYLMLADSVAHSFCQRFLHDTNALSLSQYSGGGYGTGTGGGMGDGSYIFAAAMLQEMMLQLPEWQADSALLAMCKNKIQQELQANHGHLNTGIYGTALFFEVLCDLGLANEAYTAMTKQDFPSFGHWIKQGAQTTWEQWNGQDSHNHPMFGSALTWLYRRLCGMQTDPEAPGYKHIIFRPTFVDGVSHAAYTTQTAYGTTSIGWQRTTAGTITVTTTVPHGATATLYLPNHTPVKLQPGTATHTL